MSIAWLAVAMMGAWLLLLVAFRRRLLADWREPVLSSPVLIVESDDWGPGPAEDARRLERLTALLGSLRDGQGHPPVVTLGIVLAVPGALAHSGGGYAPRQLDAPEFAGIRGAMLAGRDAGVFALQLHGMEHFWPPALEAAAQRDPAVHAFLYPTQEVPRHEALPSHLQVRWVDAAQLPSHPLPADDIERAVTAETACFARVFGMPATVAVPVTFTWTAAVEAAWARHGVRTVVTPGTRNTGRDRQGRLVSDGSVLRNGDRGAGDVLLVVRDIYFEPALGHTADTVVRGVGEYHRLGRPALLEMHRFNFTGDPAQADRSAVELMRLLQGALATIPGLRFMSTQALAEALRARDPALVDRRAAARLRALVLRAAGEHRLRKLAWISGLAIAAAAVVALASTLLLRPAVRPRIG